MGRAVSLDKLVGAYRRGMHFVLLRDTDDGKKPAWRGWPERRPGPVTVGKHLSQGLPIGWIPARSGAMVVDQDQGRLDDLLLNLKEANAPPNAILRSGKPGRHHLVYNVSHPETRDVALEASRKWEWRGCSGEIVSRNGQYAKLHDHDEALRTIIDNVLDERSRCTLPPFIAERMKQETEGTRTKNKRNGRSGQALSEQPPVPPPSEVREGNRNTSLFEYARHEIYAIRPECETLDELKKRAVDACHDVRELFPCEREPEQNLINTAHSMARWTWSVGPVSGRRRSSAHQSRAALMKARKVELMWMERADEIKQLMNSGATNAEIAQHFGCSVRQFQRWKKQIAHS